jgi:hypothetical protein
VSQETASQIELIDHAFFTMVQDDRGFRQALILDKETALAQFRITQRAENRLDTILQLIDSLTAALVKHWVKEGELEPLLANEQTRRVLLFAPKESITYFKLSKAARNELTSLAEMANAMAEVLFGAGRET